MQSEAESQALCGPFLSTDLVSYQAAVEHFDSQWRPLLSTSAADIVRFVLSMTVRFKRRFRKISIRTMLQGIPPNPEKGFSGIARIRCEKSAAYAALAELRRIGILTLDCYERMALDFSKLATDLANDETLRANTAKANRRGGIFSTEDGILKWALAQARWLLGAVEQEAPQEAPVVEEASDRLSIWESKHSGYTRNYRTKYLSGDKSPSRNVREWFMGKAEDLKASILAAVAERGNRLQAKRASRATLADRATLAENAWRKGQTDRDRGTLPGKLIPRDRKLLKDHIIRAAEGLDFDPADFLHWCAVNWDGIGGAFFQKAKSYPTAPAFPWLVRCLQTYSEAYRQRDTLDLSAAGNPSQRVSAQAVAAISQRAEKAVTVAAETVADLQAQLREARAENTALRQGKALPIDDDPVYARASKLASRKITIGRFDDDDERPVRRKLARHRK